MMANSQLTEASPVAIEHGSGLKVGVSRTEWFALIIFMIALSLMLFGSKIDFIYHWPTDAVIPLGAALSKGITYVTSELTFFSLTIKDVTRAAATILAWPQTFLSNALVDGFSAELPSGNALAIPALPWFSLVFVLLLGAYQLGGVKLAALTGVTIAYCLASGLAESTLYTLTVVLVSVTVCVAGGLLLGVLAYRSPVARMLLEPLYDVMQTLPIFSYLVLIVVLFGFGPVAGLVAIVIFAMPPMARMTTLGLQQNTSSIHEFGIMAGCTNLQRRWLVEVPAARQHLLLGVNQVIMLALATIIVAAIIGGQGLGSDVLRALKSMRLGEAFQAGLAITLLAVTMDRGCRAWVERRPAHTDLNSQRRTRRIFLAVVFLVSIGGMCLVTVWPQASVFPASLQFDFGSHLNQMLREFNSNWQPLLGSLRDHLVLGLLRPLKDIFQSLPWLPSVLVCFSLALALAGVRTALSVVAMLLFIVVTGLWEKAMLSLYLVSVATLVALLIGLPLGVWAGLSKRANVVLQWLVDILQTLPAFIYLIPVVILFGIGDFPAFLGIALYTLAPVIRYTAASLHAVDPSLKEAAMMSGCSGPQRFVLVDLPLALPQLLMGFNQTIMLAFSMLAIVGLVGSQGLESVTLVAVAQVKPGEGLVAGVGIAALAMVLDRLFKGASVRLSTFLKLPSIDA
ncbi:ABC transporter permease subunit [Pseudomonas sp.]|uniref:ABC transporter permease n=1 Tax=Pseudomonas sp. TaxID=306 RepID=UPI0024893483|nr:ABC transporter permease subunit [Pseudomonas sp.]MDI1332509.1 ABC transporter permease subunit [Pseudomonas sp.]